MSKKESFKISEMTNERILEIKADPRKFNIFMNRNKGFLSQITLKFARKSDSHYDDMYQIACIGLFKALDTFDEKSKKAASLSTWAWKVIKNDLLQECQRINKKNAHEHSMEKWKLVESSESTEDSNDYFEAKWKPLRQRLSLEDEIINKISKEQMLNKFSNTEKNIIILKQQGYKMNEIAKILQKNIHTIRSMYFYVTKRPEFKQFKAEI